MQATAEKINHKNVQENVPVNVLVRIREFLKSEKFINAAKKVTENVVVATLIGIPGTITYNYVKNLYLKLSEEGRAKLVGLLAGTEVMLLTVAIIAIMVIL